jgi:small subunit ribosomal protein S1
MNELSQQGEAQEKEVMTSNSEASMSELVDSFDLNHLRPGQVVEGTIVSVRPDAILVDVGAKTEGIVGQRELDRMSPEERESLQPGDKILVYVVRSGGVDGALLLSISRAAREKDWREAERLYKSREAFQAPVAGFNRGGLIVKIGGLRGFVPASQLAPDHKVNGESSPQEVWGNLVGQELFFKVIEVDPKRNRLILSERAAMRERRKAQKEKLLESLQVGDIRNGVVTSVTEFGAFVDLGGADGLVHVSEMTWGKGKKPKDVVSVGDEVQVYVLGIDKERQRIALSLKRANPNPWDTVVEKYAIGQLVEAVITNLADFGAFAELEDGVEGLIHISELSDQRVEHPRDVVKPGDKVTVRIIKMNPEKKKIGLSIRLVPEEKYAVVDWVPVEEPEELEEGGDVAVVMEEALAAVQEMEQAEATAPTAEEAEAPEAAPSEPEEAVTETPEAVSAEPEEAPAGTSEVAPPEPEETAGQASEADPAESEDAEG